MDYLFTDDAYLLTNYGVEGEAYIIDADGNPQWTDLVANNPDGLSFFFAGYRYAANAATTYLPRILDVETTFQDFTDDQWDIYNACLNLPRGEYNFPAYVKMTSEEESRYNNIKSDLSITYEEMTLRFIVGDADIDEEFDAYVQNMYQLGLQELINIKQASYDRYFG